MLVSSGTVFGVGRAVLILLGSFPVGDAGSVGVSGLCGVLKPGGGGIGMVVPGVGGQKPCWEGVCTGVKGSSVCVRAGCCEGGGCSCVLTGGKGGVLILCWGSDSCGSGALGS